MGAAWRDVPDGPEFDRVLAMVRVGPRARHGGVLHARHADAGAGRRARRGRAHGVQPQPRHRRRSSTASIITTRTYDDRLDTLARVRQVRRHRLLRRHHRHGRGPRASATGCCSSSPRSTRIPRACRSTCWSASRARRSPTCAPEDPLELVRTIATARILMPRVVRAPERRPSVADRRGAGALLPGRAPTPSSSATAC